MQDLSFVDTAQCDAYHDWLKGLFRTTMNELPTSIDTACNQRIAAFQLCLLFLCLSMNELRFPILLYEQTNTQTNKVDVS